MSNINQTQDLFALGAMQDLDNETAATCSGGSGYFGSNDPDIILYEDANFQGRAVNVNASPEDGVNLTGELNDSVSSMKILRGTWRVTEDDNFRNGGTYGSLQLGPGDHEFGGTPVNDTISSLFRFS